MKLRRATGVVLLAILGLSCAVALRLRDLGRPVTTAAPLAVEHTAPVSPAVSPGRSPGLAQKEQGTRGRVQFDLAAALELIRSDPDPLTQQSLLAQLADQVPIPEVQSSLEFLKERSGSKLDWELAAALVRLWAEEDPASAAAWTNLLPVEFSRREQVLKTVAIAWANQDPAEALDWVRQLPRQHERVEGLSTIAYELARTEPAQALALANELPNDEGRNDLLAHAALQWAATAPEPAAAWTGQLADTDLRERLVAGIATVWADVNPSAALGFALDSLPQGKLQDDAVVGIVQRWAQTQPAAAAAWVEQFPLGSVAGAAVEEMTKLWADANFEQGANWLMTLPAGPVRDTAFGAYAGQIAPRFPEWAAQWALSIEDEELRFRGLTAVGETWKGIDSSAARAWIGQTALPEEVKARLLAPSTK